MMNILLLHKWMPLGGVETVLINYLHILQKLEHQVEILFTYDLGQENCLIAHIPEEIPYQFVFDEHFFHHKTTKQTSISREWMRFQEKRLHRQALKKKLSEKSFDLIIDFSGCLDQIIRSPLPLMQLRQTPTWRWIHGQLNNNEPISTKQKRKFRHIFTKHQKVIVLCDAMKELLQKELNLSALYFTVLPNPIYLENIQEKQNQPLPVSIQKPYLLQVSRLCQGKRLDLLLDAYVLLKQRKGFSHKLYIIGDGELKDSLQNKIETLHLENDVFLLGAYNNPFPFFHQADLFVHTSETEGLPTVLLESMACGTPVVAMDCLTGPKDIIGAKNEYGCLIPLYDVA